MELKQLEAFVKVVELRSFSKAAKSLHLTQPTISVHIVSLEKELDTSLLERTTKSVSITEAGERLYEYAKEMIEIREDIFREFEKKDNKDSPLEIAGSTIPSQYMLPELLSVFQENHKKMRFSINQGDSRYVIDEILKHRVDLGFVGMKINDQRLHYIPFYEDRITIVTPNNKYYKEILEEEDPLEKLVKEPIILRESGSGTKKAAWKFLESRQIDMTKLNVIAQINNQDIIKSSVSKGIGISLISKKAAADYAEMNKILMYEPKGEPIIRTLYIVFGKRKKFNSMEKRFIEFCRDFYDKR